jgi:Domain of unknown function (DUF4349)
MATPDRRPSRRAHTSVFAALMIVAVLALGACASSASAPREPSKADFGPALAGDLTGAPVPAAGSATDGKTGTGTAVPDLATRKIVKTGDITIEVPNVATALARVRTMALQLGGYVGGSQAGTLDQSATLTLRIPADKFDDAIARLHELDGTVLGESTQEEDVTSSLVDLQARLTNLQASESQYRLLLAKAEKIDDILAVQTRLDDVRGQIEQLQAQQKELSGLADLATLTVTLTPGAVQQATTKWDPGKAVSDAFAALIDGLQGIANGAIWFAIVWLPGLVVLAIVLWLLWRVLPGLRRRTPPPAAVATSDAASAPPEQE